jgi:hypothetical protein
VFDQSAIDAHAQAIYFAIHVFMFGIINREKTGEHRVKQSQKERDALGDLSLYRSALDAGIGMIGSARHKIKRLGSHVIAYNPTDGTVCVLVMHKGVSNDGPRFQFIGTAFELSSYFQTLVVPAQLGLRPSFSYSTSSMTIHGYRFKFAGRATNDQPITISWTSRKPAPRALRPLSGENPRSSPMHLFRIF